MMTLLGDLGGYPPDWLLRDLLSRRVLLATEQHDVVRTTLHIGINEIIAELDRRNVEVLESRMGGAR